MKWAILAATAAAAARAQDVPTCSGLPNNEMLVQPNSYCEVMGQMSTSVSFEACCNDEASTTTRRMLAGSSRALQVEEEVCRTVTMDSPYCSGGFCTADMLSSTDKLSMDLTIGRFGEPGTCCDECRCYGDPECVAFDGSRDEWILCDGRREDNCLMSEHVCENQKDHAGRSCVWLPESDQGWAGRPLEGSPCQADWATSGYPTMTMYSADSLKVDLELAERGVISKIMFTASDGSEHSLTSVDCFAYDPRVGANPFDAWQTSGAGISSIARFETPNDVETVFYINDPEGVYVEVLCTRARDHIYGRLHVEVVEPRDARLARADGYCVNKVISEKSESEATIRSKDVHAKCLLVNLPPMINTCRLIVDDTCREYTLDENIDKWCEGANLIGTDVEGNVDECKDSLKYGKGTERSALWVKYLCQINNLDVDDCTTIVSQFGLEEWLETHSDGYSVPDINTESTCASDVQTYVDVGASSSTCEQGVSVEYLAPSGEWVEAFFVPARMPPCSGSLDVTASQMPELFLYQVRFRQCDLTDNCLHENQCRPAVSFDVAATYASDVCPTPSPTSSPSVSPTKNPTVSPTKNPTESPTASPTKEPTTSPTKNPTASPTASPTKNPTTSPTESPTASPTKNPTVSPTSSPTKNPTTSPTKNPTASPTASPTKNPTTSPTESPTASPTKNPTVSPTTSPTKNPTTSPTESPTSSPTKNPTTSPTKDPTVSPTASPTKNPTVSPTVSPTKEPTKNPTVSPTSSPTKDPTKNPTVSPTVSPTKEPTKNPTVSPTSSPTKDPTKNPTVSPTVSPTSSPICTTTITQGTCDETVMVPEEYTVTFSVELNSLVCGSDANVFSYGCGEMLVGANVKDCSTAVEILVQLAPEGPVVGEPEYVSCLVPEDTTPLYTENKFEVTVMNGQLEVYVNGEASPVCSKPLGGSVLPVEDACVCTSSPDMEAAGACLQDLTIVQAPTPSPTQSPTCLKTTEAGSCDTNVDMLSEYTVTFDVELNDLVCVQEDANIFSYGCDTDKVLMANVKDCSNEVEFKVMNAAGEEKVCNIDSSLTPLGTQVSFTVIVDATSITVLVNDVEACSEDIGTEGAMAVEDACVCQSAANMPEAAACFTGLTLVNAPTPSPTPAPTGSPICETNLIAGNNNNNLRQDIPEQYEVFLSYELNDIKCVGEDSNLFQYGCDNNMVVGANVKDCTTEVIVLVQREAGGKQECVIPAEVSSVGSPVEVLVTVTGGNMRVRANGVEICDDPLMGGVAKTAERACVYTSAPERVPAPACNFLLSFRSIGIQGTCMTCTREESQTICDDPDNTKMRTLGECESCCTAQDGFEDFNDEDGPKCRQLEMPAPYCDLNSGDSEIVAKCEQLGSTNGKLEIKINSETLTSADRCCKHCTCYGDPECEAFDGSREVWILCDGRDTTCHTKEEVCRYQDDHAGNQCVWDEQRAKDLVYRADIGAIGSPCQADWEKSGEAWMTMYDIPNVVDTNQKSLLTVDIRMGERGVLEETRLTTPVGTYWMIADDCFIGDGMGIWSMSDGAAPADEVFEMELQEGPGPDHRTWLVTHRETKVFFRVLCIRRISKNKKFVGYRMNVQSLIETEMDRPALGYCAEGTIDTRQSTTNTTDIIFDECMTGLDSMHTICKELWINSCTPNQVAVGVRQWCLIANLYQDDPNGIDKCVNYIGDSFVRWEEMYCQAIQHKAVGLTPDEWVRQCRARIETDGIEAVVQDYGKGTYGSNGIELLCGADENAYAPRTPAQACLPGWTLEYQNENGRWVEELFFPANLPPCGRLELSAERHYHLFTRPIRFKECEIDHVNCPVDVACLPNNGGTIRYKFSQDEDVCTTDTRRLL